MTIELVTTVYIIQNKKVLLIDHKKLKKWLPPGGHIEPNECPHEGAKREALEETGLEIEFYLQENVWVNRWNAKSLPRPFMSLLEEIPEYKEVKAHKHCDLIFLGYPIGGELNPHLEEVAGAKWFGMQELKELIPDVEIFTETLVTIEKIFEIEPTLQKELSETMAEC